MRATRYCRTAGKVRFRDHAEAVTALHAAATARHVAACDAVTTVRKEKRCYECKWCRGWHLTSQEKKPTFAKNGTRPESATWVPRAPMPANLRSTLTP